NLANAALEYFQKAENTFFFDALSQLIHLSIGHAGPAYLKRMAEKEELVRDHRLRSDSLKHLSKLSEKVTDRVIEKFGSGGDRTHPTIQAIWDAEGARFSSTVNELLPLWNHIKELHDDPTIVDWEQTFWRHTCHQCEELSVRRRKLSPEIIRRV